MNRFGIQLLSLLAGGVILFVIAQQLITDHAVPSLGEFMASSTEVLASSTTADEIASTTAHSDLSAFSSTSTARTIDLLAPVGVIHAMVADTDVSREQGLSDRTSLSKDAGVLFVFDVPGQYGFWMKSMHFPIDIVWIKADKTVAGVTKDISPDTYPSIFMPPGPISYVLEVNAGSADTFSLSPGVAVRFDPSNN